MRAIQIEGREKRMLRLPMIVVLMVSIMVGRASPVQQKEHGSVKVDVAVNSKNTSDILANSTSKMIESSVKIEDKKEDNKVIKLPTSTTGPPAVDATTPINEQKPATDTKKNCTSNKEQEDMVNCYVMPHDDDDIIEQNVSSNSTVPTVNTTTSNKTETSTESTEPKTQPQEKGNDEKKTVEIVVNSTEANYKVPYDVASTEEGHSSNTTSSDVSSTLSKHDDSTSIEPISQSVAPLLIDKAAANTRPENVVAAVKSADEANDKSMPSGVIALVTAISFAVAIALAYIGMIIWRRYIEYRYGHRELLVNELEFDTNDLRHFEL